MKKARGFFIRFNVFLAVLFMVANAFAPSVSALSQEQKRVFDSGIYYFDTETCSDISSEPGSGPLYGPFFPNISDPSELVPRITDYIKNHRPDSPLIAFSSHFVQLGQQYNANPAMVVGMAQKETSLGTDGFGTPSGGYNITNLRPGGSFARYASYQQGIEEAYKNLAGRLYLGEPSKFTTVEQVINRWAPPSENDTPGYIRLVIDTMHKILDGTATTDSPSTASTKLDLDAIAKKYGLQSVLIKQMGGARLGSVNANTPPVTPASVLKIIIADVFLSTNPNLKKSVTVMSKQIYKSGDAQAGNPIMLRDVLQRTLSESWNTGANILIDASGGFSAATSAANKLGYTRTKINQYFHDPPGQKPNETTVEDLTKAMEKIFITTSNTYTVAQDALRSGENHFNITPPPDASKWGATSSVTGNSAVFSVGANKYIITLYRDKGQADSSIKQATEEILKQIGGEPSSFTAGSLSLNHCQGTNNYQAGANGYDLSGSNAMAHFYQCDPQWADEPYGPKFEDNPSKTICESGCGIATLAMVVNTLAGSNETPLTLANKYGNSYNGVGGTQWALWPVAARDYGLKEQDIGLDFNAAARTIRQGGLVIISVKAGYFTTGGHLMVLRAVDEQGNFYLADPNGPNNPRQDEDKPFSVEFLKTKGNAFNMFAFTK